MAGFRIEPSILLPSHTSDAFLIWAIVRGVTPVRLLPPSPSLAAPGPLVVAFLWSFGSFGSFSVPCPLAALPSLGFGPFAAALRWPCLSAPSPRGWLFGFRFRCPCRPSAAAPWPPQIWRAQAPKTSRILNQIIFGSGLRPYDGSTSAHLCDSAYTRQLVRVICLPCMVFIIFCFDFS